MLAEFQQALTDLVRSPDLCRDVRVDPEILLRDYDLSSIEFERLQAMANHPGMVSNCVLYRANRLAPLALNLRELCRGLGADLKWLLAEFWEEYPNTDVNFLVECDRFAAFLVKKQEQGFRMSDYASAAFEREVRDLRLRIAVGLSVL